MIEKESRPAYQWYPKEFLSSSRVMRMTLEAEGAYRRLLDFQWMDGSIPADVEELAGLCRVTASKMRILWRTVGPCFEHVAGDEKRLQNPRLERARREMTEFAERRSEAGRRGAAITNGRRWGDGQATVERPPSDGGATVERQQGVVSGVGIAVARGQPASATASAVATEPLPLAGQGVDVAKPRGQQRPGRDEALAAVRAVFAQPRERRAAVIEALHPDVQAAVEKAGGFHALGLMNDFVFSRTFRAAYRRPGRTAERAAS